MTKLEPTFFIGHIPVYGERILAPMDGFSDVPYRTLCRRFGSALSYTAFVNAMELIHGLDRAWAELQYQPQERPIIFQIFDDDEARLLEAALRIQELEPDAIDVNMGCSARRVSNRGAGAGLLRDPQKIGRIIHALSTKLDVPITAKIRLGWDNHSRNYLDVARAIEENGGALIAVHGRTREQGYHGRADWDAITEIKERTSIPIIGNGDVKLPEDVTRLQEYTGCDAVMIGRGAIGNPWIFQGRGAEDVSFEELMTIIHEHQLEMIRYYGEDRGIILFRKHLVRYIAHLAIDKDHRQRLLSCREWNAFLEITEQIPLNIPSAEAYPTT
jgi:nifR3 family TIM-barrel protein